MEVLSRLAAAGEFRDNETGLHVQRMSHYTERLAHFMGFDEEECGKLLLASPLHDIGKIGVPDGILLKPGKLTTEEFETIKSHTIIGGKILEGSDYPLLELARLIALTHHEKFDGSGYPNGLKGEEIPIEGRIVAVADVFDALTSSRPYKPGWPIDRAVTLLKDGAGSHFDPEVVKHFVNNLGTFIAIRERFNDPE